ncbi:V-type ATPase 116kDa subunit domain protein [Treponema socranskii subsp. socranskii VPI DR56BR1116 = ATCC 35536]|uniref:V-type ATPase 116kDa subunit domain protein n=1 Tax=Treponema socranskii subsp. socranskii VPI DR56BR1116 = ATCC 35536 TaxID=1125725 RepID=U1GWN3_TRESO|nr:V-type ATPase 116kDa subunit family protein [Treponema socranskii]ERF60974.1 V-type ATPase 116kDa subunit domain protein [Treponema socranskii subsp. socranskii VPI DR56BR1116 = ATCC 35536]ERK03824.1 V-type ATPase 116kDa subunit domain protein [Treponema socranskii subsp. socranskii VPI DR56BR1116 = ATCC 35536]
MARTTEMRLIELMTLRQDISKVIEYLGKKGNFQFQTKLQGGDASPSDAFKNADKEFFDNLQRARIFLAVPDRTDDGRSCSAPSDADRDDAAKLLAAVDDLKHRVTASIEEAKRVDDAYKEALAFSNLKASYSELEHLSFLSLRIGKIDPTLFEALKDAVGERAVVIPLGNDNSRILAASSKKGRFVLDTELKKFNFVNMEIPQDFKGIPDDVLSGLKNEKSVAAEKVTVLEKERSNFAETHREKLLALLGAFSIGMQIQDVESKLQSTELVYRLTGWVSSRDSKAMMKELDELTEGRIAIREYLPSEVPSVINGKEQVPVEVHHRKFVKGFERMLFSYGAPVYGTIDPTPFVALFFTLLFGIMFGDFGQGLVIFLLGILLEKRIVRIGSYNRSAPVFIAVGASSMIMGLLTGEFFTNETLLEPFAYWVTGFFGKPHAPIIKLMPSGTDTSAMFAMFGVAIAVGFLINTIGLIINITNKFIVRKPGRALFGKTGLAGACFFWYIVALVVRVLFFHQAASRFDFIVIGVLMFFAAFGEPFERLVDGERPIAENGIGALVISGVVELIEVISTYLSNSVSFLRVGAFALAHAVLAFVISMLADMIGSPGGIIVTVLGNALVIVLEGMIVAIQVVRLQYYEFFSKFFNETGVEFSPFCFTYKQGAVQ